jgi:hypothetical protein
VINRWNRAMSQPSSIFICTPLLRRGPNSGPVYGHYFGKPTFADEWNSDTRQFIPKAARFWGPEPFVHHRRAAVK